MNNDQILAQFDFIRQFAVTELSSPWFYLQVVVLVVIALASWLIGRMIRSRFDLSSRLKGWPAPLRMVARAIVSNFGITVFLILSVIARLVFLAFTWPSRSYFIAVAVDMASAWLVIQVLAGMIRNRAVMNIVAVLAWAVAALSILNLLDNVMHALDAVAVTIGGLRLSLLLVVKLAILFAVSLWVALTLSKLIESRIDHSADLTPSIRVLLGKMVRLALIALAIVVVMAAAGIDLSALAFFSGAIGVGVGLGLQKIVSNFVSGVILLTDKSIKPGDIISVGDSFGRVSSMNTRYISVSTRDGREYLVPNEDMVTQKVINWTYSDRSVQLEVKFAVENDADIAAVQAIAVEAARSAARVLAEPHPYCHVSAINPGAVELIVRFWINDPEGGMGNVRSVVMIALIERLKGAGVALA